MPKREYFQILTMSLVGALIILTLAVFTKEESALAHNMPVNTYLETPTILTGYLDDATLPEDDNYSGSDFVVTLDASKLNDKSIKSLISAMNKDAEESKPGSQQVLINIYDKEKGYISGNVGLYLGLDGDPYDNIRELPIVTKSEGGK